MIDERGSEEVEVKAEKGTKKTKKSNREGIIKRKTRMTRRKRERTGKKPQVPNRLPNRIVLRAQS